MATFLKRADYSFYRIYLFAYVNFPFRFEDKLFIKGHIRDQLYVTDGMTLCEIMACLFHTSTMLANAVKVRICQLYETLVVALRKIGKVSEVITR